MFERNTQARKVTWSASTDSAEIALDGVTTGLQLILPATFTGTTLTYKTRTDAGAWIPIHKAGAAVSDTVAGSAATCNVLKASDLFGLKLLKIISNQTETCEGQLLCTA